MDNSFFAMTQLMLFLPSLVLFVLTVYALILAIRALRIYINKNSN
jgi:hypothetical protein